MPIIEEQLATGKSVELPPRGISMLPLIREGRDSVTLSPPPKKLKKYDLPLYRRKDGSFVLHRVVGLSADGYIMAGDNQFVYEKGITDGQIIAVVTAIKRGGRTFKVDNRLYRLYAVLWQKSRGVRYLFVRGWRKLGRILKRK